MSSERITTRDGKTIDFLPDMIGEGGMKRVYLTADKQSVVCFFKDQQDISRLTRLEAVLGKYNPTTDPQTGEYWKKIFCWPTAIVQSSKYGMGVVAPKYPGNFFFKSGPWTGKEKEGRWFFGRTAGGTFFRDMMPEVERGNWLQYFSICIQIARAARRLHVAGLAHSDLSSKNVLVDPVTGTSIVIDIDSLVVPGLFPPDVVGTPGYIAPEVLSTIKLAINDPKRKHACAATDQYALAVLIYEYLLTRHPLRGPKIHSTISAEEDDYMGMGPKALWIEDPGDKSNRSTDIKVPYTALGPLLAPLFERAFVNGLHAPNNRPSAGEWEKALVKTWDMLYPCPNGSCGQKWIVAGIAGSLRCPWCGSQVRGQVPMIKLRTERRAGNWMHDGQLVVRHNMTLFRWHAFDNEFPGETADRTPQAYCVLHQGKWLLVNQALTSLTSPGGNRVPAGQAVELADGVQFRLSTELHGRMVEVQMLTN